MRTALYFVEIWNQGVFYPVKKIGLKDILKEQQPGSFNTGSDCSSNPLFWVNSLKSSSMGQSQD